ncbi:response regulator transcription factor [Terrisporobacter glycolicus]|uniref:Stage 0 sporulation protein A homolog n=1 Tax=Terrisporobacter glycolicus ATCC 14880 = DSM 1288 TaxID=1121315 RepID=A0ABZ2ETN3_9FIRM|nr:response regulator transcription factor [Terrisporobacter glycolicus]
MAKILIIDDEEKICEFIAAYLIKSGHSVYISNSGEDGLNKINNEKIDLIILDRMIPDISGDEICKYLKNNNINTPIIMITAKTEVDDRIEGFELGCDDYICKPFSPKEMVVRVNAMIRRCNINKINYVKFNNGLEVNQDTRKVKIRGKEIELTKTEYEIIDLMTQNPHKIYTREELLDKVIDESYDKLDRVIDTHIKNLRKKIEIDSKKPKIIKTVYGVGYKFEE